MDKHGHRLDDLPRGAQPVEHWVRYLVVGPAGEILQVGDGPVHMLTAHQLGGCWECIALRDAAAGRSLREHLDANTGAKAGRVVVLGAIPVADLAAGATAEGIAQGARSSPASNGGTAYAQGYADAVRDMANSMPTRHAVVAVEALQDGQDSTADDTAARNHRLGYDAGRNNTSIDEGLFTDPDFRAGLQQGRIDRVDAELIDTYGPEQPPSPDADERS